MDRDDEIPLVLYRRKDVFDYLLISPDSVRKSDEEERKKNGKIAVVRFNKRGCDSYLASVCLATMRRNVTFCKSMFTKLTRLCEGRKPTGNEIVFLKLLTPKRQFLDYRWNEIVNNMVIERQNIEYAMSWLSTLGGAFSALGDSINHCAEVAGKISIEQFKLSMRLGDPSLVARCKLYAALSLIQRKYLNYPKKIIKEVFDFAKKIDDIRLQRMSQGIWEKLRYYRYLKKQKKFQKHCRIVKYS